MSALAKIADLPSDIMERSQEAILTEVSKQHAGGHPGRSGWRSTRSLTEAVSRVLNGYGVYVLQAQLTEFAPCRAFAINGHAAIGNYALWTGF